MSNSLHNPSDRAAFTLMELLAVIAIIFILLSLLLPAAIALRERSKMKQAATEAQMIANSVKAYRSTYGKWPCQTQGVTDSTNADCATLMGALTTDATLNPRGITFIEMPVSSIIAGAYTDPWSTPYIIVMDNNEDGGVDVALTAPFALSTNIPNETAVVISGGPNPTDPAKRIYSWNR